MHCNQLSNPAQALSCYVYCFCSRLAPGETITVLQGMRIFRMNRHEQFLQQMLWTISHLYKKYVRTDSSPPVNMFFEQAAYQQFLGTTLHVAESVQVISDLDYQTLPDVHDSKMFL